MSRRNSIVPGFADRLKEMREKRKLTQEQLARALGVSNMNVSRWERGLMMPQCENIRGLHRVLRVSTDYLLIGDPPALERFWTTDAGRYASERAHYVAMLRSMQIPEDMLARADKFYLAVVWAVRSVEETHACLNQ